MKRVLYILFLLFIGQAHAQPVEEMEYSLGYSFITAGKAVLTANDTTFDGKPVVHYYLIGKTTGLADRLFSVHDIYESYIDPRTYLPVKAVRNIREQKYRWYNEVLFDRENNMLHSQKSGPRTMPEGMTDILGMFFYLRKNNFLDKLGQSQSITLPVLHGDDDYMMEVKYLGLETIKTKLGDVQCHVVSPHVSTGKLLKRSDGLKFYITNDERRLPVYMEFDMKIGYLRCELVQYRIRGVNQIRN